MRDQIKIQQGSLPWEPADDAKLATVFNAYNRPLAGIIEQGGNYFFFACLEGEASDPSLWAYALADDPEFKSGYDAASAVHYFETTYHPVLLAVSENGRLAHTVLLMRGTGRLMVDAQNSLRHSNEALLTLLE